LDTPGPFAGFMIPLFAWLAGQENILKGKAVRLGMKKAMAKGRPIGRPVVVDSVDAGVVAQLRAEDTGAGAGLSLPPVILNLSFLRVSSVKNLGWGVVSYLDDAPQQTLRTLQADSG